MITIQMYEALSAKALFDKISQEKLPIKTAYKLSKIYKKQQPGNPGCYYLKYVPPATASSQADHLPSEGMFPSLP